MRIPIALSLLADAGPEATQFAAVHESGNLALSCQSEMSEFYGRASEGKRTEHREFALTSVSGRRGSSACWRSGEPGY
jgi:hypothetical protein